MCHLVIVTSHLPIFQQLLISLTFPYLRHWMLNFVLLQNNGCLCSKGRPTALLVWPTWCRSPVCMLSRRWNCLKHLQVTHLTTSERLTRLPHCVLLFIWLLTPSCCRHTSNDNKGTTAKKTTAKSLLLLKQESTGLVPHWAPATTPLLVLYFSYGQSKIENFLFSFV